MAKTTTVTCDGPSCGKDISQGEGRSYRINVSWEAISVAQENAVFRKSGGRLQPVMQFCSEACTAATLAGIAQENAALDAST